MKAKVSLYALMFALLLALGMAAGCQRGRSDAQIATEVQGKINSDSAIPNKQINVQSSNGVVTLSGTVNTDMERMTVASDAAQVGGVKTVVNNLQVTSAQASGQQAATLSQEEANSVVPPAAQAAAPRRARATPRRPAAATSAAASTPAVTLSAPPAPAPAPAAPAGPPPITALTIPEGTQLSIRLIDEISSEKNKPGDVFHATMDTPIIIEDRVAVPKGADVEGRVTDVKGAGHFSGRSDLALELSRLTVSGKSYELHTTQYSKQGAARGTRTAETIGGGAALGAIIGGIAGGGKGAAIGAAAGAGAGTGVQGVTHGEQVKLPSETVLNFRLQSPLTVTPSSGRSRSSNE